MLLELHFKNRVDTSGDSRQEDGDTIAAGSVAQLGLVTEQAHLLNAFAVQGQIQGIVLEVKDVNI